MPKSQTRHPARAQALLHLPHRFFWHDKTLQTLPLFAVFPARTIVQSPHKNIMSGANTRRLLAGFCDNNCWNDFTKTCQVKKHVCSLCPYIAHVNNYYYTLNSLTLFWLAESVQWIFEISARDAITADYTIIMSRSRVIMSCMTAVHDFQG